MRPRFRVAWQSRLLLNVSIGSDSIDATCATSFSDHRSIPLAQEKPRRILLGLLSHNCELDRYCRVFTLGSLFDCFPACYHKIAVSFAWQTFCRVDPVQLQMVRSNTFRA